MLSSRWFQGLLAVVIVGSFLAWQAPRWVGQHAVDEAAAQPRPVAARGDLAADEKATVELFERSKGSVVYISTTARVLDLFSRNIFTIPQGTGSGFVWDERGHIVTNNHVVTNAAGARVRLNDGRDYNATLVGASPVHDLAVLRIAVAHRRPPPLRIGTSSDLKVGQKVFAIGNPFGLDWSLTTGIVSALDRALPDEDGKGALEGRGHPQGQPRIPGRGRRPARRQDRPRWPYRSRRYHHRRRRQVSGRRVAPARAPGRAPGRRHRQADRAAQRQGHRDLRHAERRRLKHG